jgi:tetratricopeptide (TPR) repeat protein
MSTAVATANCQLQQLGTLPVDMQGLHPLVWTKINGTKARFVLDSGSFYTTISRDAAEQYRLPITPRGAFLVRGVGGSERAQIATAESFDFLGMALPKIRFAVVDQDFGELAGLLGQNLLRVSDVEYDLANGIVRFIRPVGCADQPLAYWAVSTPYSSVDLEYMDAGQSHLLANAIVNRHPIIVAFDTGASRSLLSLQAAQRAGITTSSSGVTSAGMASGIGPGAVPVWVAPVATFQIGGEKVEHTHLLIGDIAPALPLGYVGDRPPDMLLGEDFFLSHRVYVAYSQNKLYFTYNGGPLFNLNLQQAVSGKTSLPSATSASPHATAITGGDAGSDAPTDADGFRRQGMAYASMSEFGRALSDLARACELAPDDAENHYDRGMIYFQDKQYAPALKDFDTAITLQPDDIDAHLARAKVLHSRPDADPATTTAAIKADLDAVNRATAPAAGMRLTLADLYSELGDYSDAIAQVNEWLEGHPLLRYQITGWNDRCGLRAAANQDLPGALEDCNRVLDLDMRLNRIANFHTHVMEAPRHLQALDNRALVYLRLGRLQDAIYDYDSALGVNPNMPTALYGRGLAELRLGKKPLGQADLAAAEKLDKGVAQRFAKMGLAP